MTAIRKIKFYLMLHGLLRSCIIAARCSVHNKLRKSLCVFFMWKQFDLTFTYKIQI